VPPFGGRFRISENFENAVAALGAPCLMAGNVFTRAFFVLPRNVSSRSPFSIMETNSKLVLVAEDETLIRMETADMLTEAGFTVIEAVHAEEALSILRSRHAEISVLFTDVHMRGAMDGIELAQHARQNWPSIGLMRASGRARPNSVDLPSKCRFLAKPYNPEQMVNNVRQLAAAA
jgi:CheY-like chemotaxis protein